MIHNTEVTILELTNQIKAYEEQIKQLPTTQRAYLGYERKFALNDELYKFLMQKRAEAQIVMASNSPDKSSSKKYDGLPCLHRLRLRYPSCIHILERDV